MIFRAIGYLILLLLALCGAGGIFWKLTGVFLLDNTTWEHLLNLDDIFFLSMAGLFTIIPIWRVVKDFRLVSEIIKANKQLKGITSDNINDEYDNLRSTFLDEKKYKYLKYNFTAFDNSLFKIGESEYYLSVDAEEFFNKDTLMLEKVNSKLIKYWPQLFLGVGMFGTFLGLTLGIGDLNLGNDDISQLTTLIRGTKTAFFTSLYGMYFSICLSIIMNFYLGFYEDEILKLKNKINMIFRRYNKAKEIEEMKNAMCNADKNVAIINSNVGEINKNIEELSKNVGTELVKGVNEYNKSSREHLQNLTTLVETNISGLADSVSESFREKLEEIFSVKFIAAFSELKDKLIEITDKNNVEVERQTNLISEVTANLIKSKESIENFTNTTLSTFDQLMNRIENKYEDIQGSLVKSEELYKNHSSLLENTGEIISDTNKNLVEFKGIVEVFSNFTSQEETLVEFWNSNRDMMEKLNATMKEAKDSEVERLKEYQQAVLEKIENTQKVFADTMKEQEATMISYYKKNLEMLFEQYDKSTGDAIEAFTQILEKLNGALEQIDSGLKHTNEVFESEKEYSVQVKERYDENRKEIEEIVGKFEQVVLDVKNSNEENIIALEKYKDDSVAKLEKVVGLLESAGMKNKAIFDEIHSNREDLNDEFGALADRFEAAMDMFSEKIDADVNAVDAGKEFAEKVSSLTEEIKAVESKLSQIAVESKELQNRNDILCQEISEGRESAAAKVEELIKNFEACMGVFSRKIDDDVKGREVGKELIEKLALLSQDMKAVEENISAVVEQSKKFQSENSELCKELSQTGKETTVKFEGLTEKFESCIEYLKAKESEREKSGLKNDKVIEEAIAQLSDINAGIKNLGVKLDKVDTTGGNGTGGRSGENGKNNRDNSHRDNSTDPKFKNRK